MSTGRFGSVLLLVLAFSQACVRVSSTRIAPTDAAIPADSVRVFVTRAPVSYEEVAVLKAHRFLVTDGKVLASLRSKAGNLGANGILLLNARAGTERHTGTGVIIDGRRTPAVIVTNGETRVDQFERAVAIRWVEPDTSG